MHQALISDAEVDDFIIIKVHAFARKVQRAIMRDVLADEDLPVLEWQLLFSIARFGSCHLAHVTAKTSIDPAHGSRAAAALEDKGLIARKEDPKNRRRKVMSLTDAGVRLFHRLWPQAQAQMRSVTQQLEDKDFDELKRLLALITTSADVLLQDDTKAAMLNATKEENRISA